MVFGLGPGFGVEKEPPAPPPLVEEEPLPEPVPPAVVIETPPPDPLEPLPEGPPPPLPEPVTPADEPVVEPGRLGTGAE